MDKAKLSNKALQDIHEDAKDGRLKKKNIEKLADLVSETSQTAPKSDTTSTGYIYAGEEYDTLRAIPVPLTQATEWLATGKITRK